MFNNARAADYELIRDLTKLVGQNKRQRRKSLDADLDKAAAWLEEIQKTDYFGCSRAHDAQMLLQRAAGLARTATRSGPRLSAKRFAGKTWLTRPRPEIDRVGCAWLIRRFIDPKARFVFSNDSRKFPGALPFDMVDAEFSHRGEDCTFETLVKRFAIADKTLSKMAQMVHAADLEDGKFSQTDCVGIDRVLKGWARIGLRDEQLLEKGGDCFDALYEFLRK